MSFDFDDFFKQAGAKAQEALGDLEKVGVPTLQAALEQWGIDVLTKQNEETVKKQEAAVAQVFANEPAPGTFGAALAATVKNSAIQQNSNLILFSVFGLLAVGYLLARK